MPSGGTKGNRGGAKGRSGRKSKAAELGLQALLDECWDQTQRKDCIKNLAKNAKTGDMESLKLLLAYTYGKPVDRKEIKGELGQTLVVYLPGNSRKDGSGSKADSKTE